MKTVRVFAPASIANLGCGFDIMGLALDEVGDVLSVSEGDGLTIANESGVPLPEDIEQNVITPVVRKFLEMTGNRAQVDVVIKRKIYPGSGIGSSSASSAAAAFGMNELFGCPLSEEDVVVCAMEGENLASGGYHADNAAPAVMGGIVLIRGYEPLDLIKSSIRSWSCPRRRRAASCPRRWTCTPPSPSGATWAASSPACIPATSAW